jgi:hypothetical protein
MDYKEIIMRNGLNPLFWVVHKELSRGIIVRNRVTKEMKILDTK